MKYYFDFMGSITFQDKIAVGTHLKSKYFNSLWFQNVRLDHLSAVHHQVSTLLLQTCEKVNKISFWNVKLNVSKVIKMNAKVLKSVLSLSKLSNLKLKLN